MPVYQLIDEYKYHCIHNIIVFYIEKDIAPPLNGETMSYFGAGDGI